jgi:glycosyltransferase involved in cell wall biosynthesis
MSSDFLCGLESDRSAGPPAAAARPGWHAGPAAARGRIAILGNHLPRRCGIATFTSDLGDALDRELAAEACVIVAMNDPGSDHAYPPRVGCGIPVADRDAYRRAARFVNASGATVLSVQHEYGIFGGPAGAYVLDLLRAVDVPVVTTLHTVLAAPSDAQRVVMDELTGLSSRVVVMSHDGARLLAAVHGVAPERIDCIPHGVPAAVAQTSKAALQLADGPVLLTFGLLSPDKGIEYVIDAMPAILARHPRAVYVVLGATHPHVRQSQGEAYRQMLVARAAALRVGASVVFDDRFVSTAELALFLAVADVYVTPYLQAEQSTSGTLAYAVGSGRAVVSTPYRHACELLADGVGLLVPARDASATAAAIGSLLDDPGRLADLQRRAAVAGRAMTWPCVARRYLESFAAARTLAPGRRQDVPVATRPAVAAGLPIPAPDLRHLARLTDDTGIVQHATFDVPRRHDGYCLDDNARALILMMQLHPPGQAAPEPVRVLTTRYLAFVAHAFDAGCGAFRNFMTYARVWHAGPGSDDSQGRALWALGTVAAQSPDAGHRALAAELFRCALPAASGLPSPRAAAYTLLGIERFLGAWPGSAAVEAVERILIDRLLQRLDDARADDWPWFEDHLTYANARLPQALLVAAMRRGEPAAAARATESLRWLVGQHVTGDDRFAPVGTEGFYPRGGPRAHFDQQPLEACAMVSACLAAHRLTGQPAWRVDAERAFAWFLGRNPLGVAVHDPRTGGCRDGIHADRLNLNQGAESTLSWLSALAEMQAAAGGRAVRAGTGS